MKLIFLLSIGILFSCSIQIFHIAVEVLNLLTCSAKVQFLKGYPYCIFGLAILQHPQPSQNRFSHDVAHVTLKLLFCEKVSYNFPLPKLK